jgi:hypothetical protein
MKVNLIASRRHATKMNKSDPDEMIFIDDGCDEIFKKSEMRYFQLSQMTLPNCALRKFNSKRILWSALAFLSSQS